MRIEDSLIAERVGIALQFFDRLPSHAAREAVTLVA